MPRKPTVQPDPLETIEADGFTIEIRDESCELIGRGMHKRNEYERWRDEVLTWVVRQYLTPEGPISPEDDFMKTASKFSRKLQETEYFPKSGDDSSVRKKLYEDISKHLNALRMALEAKAKS